MSDTSSFHAVVDRIEDEVAVLSIEPVGKLEIPTEYLPSEIEEGTRLYFQTVIDAEGTQYLADESAESGDDVAEESTELEYMDEAA